MLVGYFYKTRSCTCYISMVLRVEVYNKNSPSQFVRPVGLLIWTTWVLIKWCSVSPLVLLLNLCKMKENIYFIVRKILNCGPQLATDCNANWNKKGLTVIFFWYALNNWQTMAEHWQLQPLGDLEHFQKLQLHEIRYDDHNKCTVFDLISTTPW